MSALPRALTRRAALGLTAAGILAGSGCSVELHNPYAGGSGHASGTGATGPGPTPSPTPGPDPDLRIVGLALDHIDAVLDRIRRAGRRHPRLARDYAATVAMHRAHADALVRARPTGAAGPGRRHPTPTPVPVPASADAARARIADAERALQHDLAALSQRAHSGGFARLLASMSAAVHQRRTVDEEGR